jgi:uncharacterized protein (DUF2235 family)
MNTESNTASQRTLHAYTMIMLLFICPALLNFGCASSSTVSKRDDFYIKSLDNAPDHKSIFVFFDGTANDDSSSTNVWRLFKQINKHKDSHTIGRYIEGVGSVNDPLEDDPILPLFGDALGRGMQDRILEGYYYIAENYKTGDEIFIFGFSRGAHQARALAGLLAYAGVPACIESNDDRREKSERILKLLKESLDEDFNDQWHAWKPDQAPLLAEAIKKDILLDMKPVEIKFLGVWDTVPGSSFKNYEACKEKIGFWKRYYHWLPMISKGERYKSGSYPPIHEIAHAVSLDEKRSKFAPLYLCEPLETKYTIVHEMWFPGAHADVGGGYGDDALPNISLNWMIDLLSKNYQFSSQPDAFTGDEKGLAHWSFGDKPANAGSHCEDRKDVEDRQPPLGYNPHPSIDKRKQVGVMPIVINKVKNDTDWSYPILCPGPGK